MLGGNPNARYKTAQNYSNAPFNSRYAPENPYGFGEQRVAGRTQMPEMGAGPENRGMPMSARVPSQPLPEDEEFWQTYGGVPGRQPPPGQEDQLVFPPDPNDRSGGVAQYQPNPFASMKQNENWARLHALDNPEDPQDLRRMTRGGPISTPSPENSWSSLTGGPAPGKLLLGHQAADYRAAIEMDQAMQNNPNYQPPVDERFPSGLPSEASGVGNAGLDLENLPEWLRLLLGRLGGEGPAPGAGGPSFDYPYDDHPRNLPGVGY